MKTAIGLILMLLMCVSPLFAADAATKSVEFDSTVGSVQSETAKISAGQIAKGLMIGLAAFGATAGIGSLVSSATEGIARQPEAADELTPAVNAGIYACVGIVAGTIAVSFFF